MHIITAKVPGAARLARVPELSMMARQRVKWMDHYRGHGRNAPTCRGRYFGISRQTFYRWKRRYDPYHLGSLEERSHRPRHLRQPTWSRELGLAVLHLRRQSVTDHLDEYIALTPRNSHARLATDLDKLRQ